jgi:hypothetical protein
MYTVIEMANGVLAISTYGGSPSNMQRWRAILQPAIALLRAHGGGSMLLPHSPDA